MPRTTRVTDNARVALLAAAGDSKGWFPVETASRVIGDLLRMGYARRMSPSNIPEISPEGREWVARDDLATGRPVGEGT